ncbi:2-hydroxychromene-2-carboxylate isomerase [Pelagibius sp. Alg239-R121]|uniref:2-hydroxychromene-2-carboxylate isomerase n=1 Tax=Pelagibius sp. Alg239-R121 TaxID=2993448 RepID=UPI0024A70060|nr:2-hydroxychromene-2-carboxylate isomerase [Pelagibius sp. Alg239-R121]
MTEDTIDYFYSIRSSFTYLGAARLNAMARKYGVVIRHYPVDLGKVIEAYNSLHDPRPSDRTYAGARAYEKFPARERYTQIEYQRWSDLLGIPIQLDPKHHYGTRELPSGVVIAAQAMGLNADRLSHDVLAALWRDDRDIADKAVMRELIAGAGLNVDPETLCQTALRQETQAQLQSNTELAVERGVFGSPFYIFRDVPFLGQDRLFFLETEIARTQES